MASELRRKVFILNVTSAAGGGPEHVFQLCSNANRDEYDFEICTPNDGAYWGKFGKLGIKLHDIALRTVSIRVFCKLLRLLSVERPDIIHSHGRGPGLYGRTIGRLLGITTVHTYHGYDTNHNVKGIRKLFYVFAERVLACFGKMHIAVSTTELNQLMRDKVVPRKKIRKIPNGIDFTSISACTAELISDEVKDLARPFDFVISVVARLHPGKRIETVIKALSHASTDKMIGLFVLGGVPVGCEGYANSIEALAEKLPSNKKVMFMGQTNKVIDFLSASNLFVTASAHEGAPLSLLEAIAVGVPMVVSRIPAHCETLEPIGFEGAYFDLDQDEQLAQLFQKYFAMDAVDYGKLMSESKKLQFQAQSKFSAKSMTDKTCQLYRDLVGS